MGFPIAMSPALQALLLQEVQEEIQRARDENVWWPGAGGSGGKL